MRISRQRVLFEASDFLQQLGVNQAARPKDPRQLLEPTNCEMIPCSASKTRAQKRWKSRFRSGTMALLVSLLSISLAIADGQDALLDPSSIWTDDFSISNNQSSLLLPDNQLDYSSFDNLDLFAADQAPPQVMDVDQSTRSLWRRQVSEQLGAGSSLDYDSYLIRPMQLRLGPESSLDYQPQQQQHLYSENQKQDDLSQQQEAAETAPIDFKARPNRLNKLGPQFVREPPSLIHYLNSSELVIPCSASGNPQPTISWWHKGAQIEAGSLLDKRYIRYDNSLVISAFKPHDYEQEIHSTIYKCQASNIFGTIVSRDVVINAVIDQDYDVSVGDQFVTVDNDAVFRCLFLPQLRDFYQTIGWFEDGQHLVGVQQAGQLVQRQQGPSQQQPVVLPDGQLYLARVQLKDANKSYRCQYKNLLNSRIGTSSLSGRLFVTDANEQTGSSPRIIVDGPSKSIAVGKLNEQLLLTCFAQGSPRPNLRWFRQNFGSVDWLELPLSDISNTNNNSNAAQANRYQSSPDGNLLLIKQLQFSDNKSRFKCLANNTFGMDQFETELQVELHLAAKLVELAPQVEFIDNQQAQLRHNSNQQQASDLTLNCTVWPSSSPLVSLEWLKNGQLIYSLSLPNYQPLNHSAGQLESIFDDPNQELVAVEYSPQLKEASNLEYPDNLEPDASAFEGSSFSSSRVSLAKMMQANLDSSRKRIRQRISVASNQQNGKLLISQLVFQLQFAQLKKSDRGAYQCRARNSRTTLQATASLMLKDNPPEFIETFQSQLIASPAAHPAKQGSPSASQQQLQQQPQAASLKCIASGSPLPEIKWTLSGFAIPESSNRYRIGDYVTRDGLIVSFVNISNVQVEDGGLYECTASNLVGQLRHQAWLNVSGPPFVRPMVGIRAIAGQSLAIMCPAGGWPLEQISWFQNSTKLPVNHRQKLFPNGTLIIGDLNEAIDNGQYSCQAKSAELIATSHVQVSIKVPPVVEPFAFAKSLHRGQRYNIMCTVVHGDLPVAIRWFKDNKLLVSDFSANELLLQDGNGVQPGQTVVQDHGIVIKHLDPYSSTLTFASLQPSHRGLYTCEASNEAGRANQSSNLVIHVPPEWKIEPKDLSVIVGRQAVIDCQADAIPAARVEWRLSQDLFRETPTEFKPIISSLYMRVFENGSLIIYNAQRTDAGFYLCQANNNVGPGLSRVIKLTVHVAAHFKNKIRTEVIRKGQPAKLKCEALGDLPIDINWLKDKMPLYSNDEPRYSISKTLLQDGIISELNILDSNHRLDSALFTCITQNQYGNDDTNIQFIVQGQPDPPQDMQIHEYGARSIKLGWTPSYSGNSPILKYIIMYAQVQTLSGPSSDNSLMATGQIIAPQQQYNNLTLSGNETSVILQNLLPLTEYQFYILAINSIGASKLPNEPIKFRTDDEAPSSPPLFVKAQPSSSKTIKVRWRVPERRPHYGAIAGFHIGYKLTGPQFTSPQQAGGADTFVYKTVDFTYQQDGGGQMIGSNNSNKSLEQECTLSGLKRAQKYIIFVQAFNNRGSGPASEPVLAETWRIDVPDPPSLRMISRTARSIHLAWRLAGGNEPALAKSQSAAQIMRKNISDRIRGRQSEGIAPGSNNKMGSKQLNSNDIGASEDDQDDSELNLDSPSASDASTIENAQANEPILGFTLTRKQMSNTNSGQDSQPIEMKLPGDHLSQIIDELLCGTRYQFTISAQNSVGVSAPSDPLIVKTEGSTPVAPDKGSLLSLNSSSVLINLAAWYNGACSMKSFDLAFKSTRSKKWTPLLTNYQYQATDNKPSGGVSSNNANSSALVASSLPGANNQLVQRSTIHPAQSNSTVVLDDLSTNLNYDLKIVATNEAGSTEALYTFNTNNGVLLGPTKGGELIGELPWLNNRDSAGGSFSELVNNLSPLLPWLLFLLFVSLSISTGCILIARRRHASSSNCSLSLSSASRSNQSSSNYYTSSSLAGNANLAATTNGTLNGATLQKLRFASPANNQQQQASDEIDVLNHPASNMMRIGDIYQHPNMSSTMPHHHQLISSDPKSNYAYLANSAQQQQYAMAQQSNGNSTLLRPDSPHNTEITSMANNGSEAEMCLGASALNISLDHNKNSNVDNSNNYYSANSAAFKQLNKSSTLPSNCHHQLIQQYVQQQQSADATTNQQIIDSIMAANIIQQQQENGLFQQPDISSLLEQQLQQQVYATVKRGCPRPPRLFPGANSYTIYQCPNSQQQQQLGEQLDASQQRPCCNESQQQVIVNGSSQATLDQQQQQHVCYQQTLDQQIANCIQQQQQSDYQQLRQIT